MSVPQKVTVTCFFTCFFLFFLIGLTFLAAEIVLAADAITVEQLSKITGSKPSTIAKKAEAFDKMNKACRLARAKHYDQAIRLLDEITVANNFDYGMERHARIEKIGTMVLKGDYAQAEVTVIQLNSEQALNKDFVGFIKAMSDFSRTQERQYLMNYIGQYNERNRNIIPPKAYDLNYLNRTVRLLEMAGEIDQALALVEQYFSKKSLKFYRSSKTREGLARLKEALLRDKHEGKNIYAQELINTTDYFGFV